MKEKRLVLVLDEKVIRLLKTYAAQSGRSMKHIVTELIKTNIGKKNGSST